MMRRPQVITHKTALRTAVGAMRQRRETVALVPTMGALHDGHLRLVAEARERCDRVIVSIFVNPTQFAANEDFGKYPRNLDSDLDKLAAGDVAAVWAPAVDEMYPHGFATRVVPAGAADGLESDFRPQFFAGVATVCAKLFTQVAPDIACFGEKDYQQLAVIRQLVRDLDLPLDIVGVPTVREADGLAMSSRNRYLSKAERQRAAAINRVLREAAAALNAGQSVAAAESTATAALTAAGFRVDYVAVRDAETLAPLDRVGERPARILAAAWNGSTRLIDNIAV